MRIALLTSLVLVTQISAAGAAETAMREGKPGIESFGHLAFAPDGILLVGDSATGSVWAVDVDDRVVNPSVEPIKVDAIDQKLAALLGGAVEEILVHDLAVNPISQNVYLSVSRSLKKEQREFLIANELDYPKALVRVTPAGKLQLVPLAKVKFARAQLPNLLGAPAKGADDDRSYTISDVRYADGKVYVAGLSNQEFSSTFRVLDYPFTGKLATTSVEMWHGAHGKFYTDAPIQTFLPVTLKGKPHLVASYTCTPLVTVAVDALVPGAHIKGTTIAEAGDQSSPTDMISFTVNGVQRVAMSNNRRPIMVFDVAEIESAMGSPVTTKVTPYHATAGAKFRMPALSGVQQLDLLNAQHAIVLMRSPVHGRLNLHSHKLERL